jgi:hypothetical protein
MFPASFASLGASIHGDTYVGLGKRGCVVRTITGHCDQLAFGLLLPIILRGSSLRNASRMARWTILHSQIAFFLRFIGDFPGEPIALSPEWE